MGDRLVSSYLGQLPAVLQQGDFIGRFLLAFEAILKGISLNEDEQETVSQEDHLEGLALPRGIDPKDKVIGFEQLLDKIHEFFDPDKVPEDFLPWLAQWVATSLRDDWSVDTKRAFIGGIVSLYRKRGTRAGIEQVLKLSGEDAKIVDFGDGVVEPAKDAFGSGEKPPYFFGVILTVGSRDPVLLGRKVRRVRAIVDREKPAHTYYGLLIKYPAMQINNKPTVNTHWGPGVIIGRYKNAVGADVIGTTILGTTKA